MQYVVQLFVGQSNYFWWFRWFCVDYLTFCNMLALNFLNALSVIGWLDTMLKRSWAGVPNELVLRFHCYQIEKNSLLKNNCGHQINLSCNEAFHSYSIGWGSGLSIYDT